MKMKPVPFSEDPRKQEIKKIIAKCIAWNFPFSFVDYPKLSWDECADAITALFDKPEVKE